MSQVSFAEDKPVDIWNLNQKKSEETLNMDNDVNDNLKEIEETKIYNSQSNLSPNCQKFSLENNII